MTRQFLQLIWITFEIASLISHNGRICAIFIPSVSSNCLFVQMRSRSGCICMIIHQSEFSNVSSNGLPVQMQSRIGCICTIFLQSEFSNVSSNGLLEQMQSRIGCICTVFLQRVISNVPKLCAKADA